MTALPQCGGGDTCSCPDGWVRLEVPQESGATVIECVLVGGVMEMVTKQVSKMFAHSQSLL